MQRASGAQTGRPQPKLPQGVAAHQLGSGATPAAQHRPEWSLFSRHSLASAKCVCVCVQASAGLEVRQEVADGRSAPLLAASQLQRFESDLQATIRALEQQEETHMPDDERVHVHLKHTSDENLIILEVA